MARMARLVIPGIPHVVTQRGQPGELTFFDAEDYRAYLELMAAGCGKWAVDIWAYCLMPDHVHLIVAPAAREGMGRAIGEAHRLYARWIRARRGGRGGLWQGRFASFPMDEESLIRAARYVELNPVRAKLAAEPGEYPWSSARAHLEGRDDDLVRVSPLLGRIRNWRLFLQGEAPPGEVEQMRAHERTGRPLGSPRFIGSLEKLLGKRLTPKKPGPKPRRRRIRI